MAIGTSTTGVPSCRRSINPDRRVNVSDVVDGLPDPPAPSRASFTSVVVPAITAITGRDAWWRRSLQPHAPAPLAVTRRVAS